MNDFSYKVSIAGRMVDREFTVPEVGQTVQPAGRAHSAEARLLLDSSTMTVRRRGAEGLRDSASAHIPENSWSSHFTKSRLS